MLGKVHVSTRPEVLDFLEDTSARSFEPSRSLRLVSDQLREQAEPWTPPWKRGTMDLNQLPSWMRVRVLDRWSQAPLAR